MLGAYADGSAVASDAFPTIGASASALFNDVLHIGGAPGTTSASLTFAIGLDVTCFATPARPSG